MQENLQGGNMKLKNEIRLGEYEVGEVVYYIGQYKTEGLRFGYPYKIEGVSIFEGDIIYSVKDLEKGTLHHVLGRFLSIDNFKLAMRILGLDQSDVVSEYDFYPEDTEQSPEKTEVDMVNSPPHYTKGGIETLDFIKAKLSKVELMGYFKGNIIKYISRSLDKNQEAEDLLKANFYSKEMAKLVEDKDECK